MTNFMRELEKGYKKYVASKLGSKRTPCRLIYINETCKAAQTLAPEYDLGIELATDGLCPGYIFHLHGFSTKAVKLGRKGRGAIWQPIDSISEQDVRGKRLLLFDNDVVTGRTLRRTVKELKKFSPEYMDLLLMHETTFLTVRKYKMWSKNYPILAVQDSFTFEPLEIRETPEGIEIDYAKEGENWHRTIELKNDRLLALKTRRNIPKGIRKVMTLEKDFRDDSRQGILNLERILRGK